MDADYKSASAGCASTPLSNHASTPLSMTKQLYCCKKTEKPAAIAFLPARNALQGRWIFDARVEMEWITYDQIASLSYKSDVNRCRLQIRISPVHEVNGMDDKSSFLDTDYKSESAWAMDY